MMSDSEESLFTFSQSCNGDKKENPHSHHFQLHHHCVCTSILLVWKCAIWHPSFILIWWLLQSLNQSDRTCGAVLITCFNSISCYGGIGWHTIDIWVSHKIGMIILYKHTLSLSDKILASFPGLHAQLLSLTVQRAGGRPGRIYHVMRAAADVT